MIKIIYRDDLQRYIMDLFISKFTFDWRLLVAVKVVQVDGIK